MLTIAFASIVSIGAVITLGGCPDHKITPSEARALAWKKIKATQKMDHFDASRLPPLHMEKRANSYYFYVDDTKQNVRVTAFVFNDGDVSEGAVALSRWKAWKNGKNIILVPPGVTVPPAVSAANAQSAGSPPHH
jgi:hypothetical protein